MVDLVSNGEDGLHLALLRPAYDIAVPPSHRIEDHLLAAIQKLTAPLKVEDVCDAVLEGTDVVFLPRAQTGSSCTILRVMYAAQQSFGAREPMRLHGFEIPIPSNTIAGLTFTNRNIMFVSDVTARATLGDPAAVHASDLQSVMSVPLVAGDGSLVCGVASPGTTP